MLKFNKHRGTLKNSPRGLSDAIMSVDTIPQLRALRPLPLDAQRLIDRTVVQVGTERLVIANDVLAEGLIYRLDDPLSVLRLDWEKVTRSGFAQRTMLPDARGERQADQYETDSVPIYITMDDFSFNIRTLRASQRVGAPLDVSSVASATRNVNEAIEDAMINGAGLSAAGVSAPGLLNAPNANTYAYASGLAWDDSSKTGQNIFDDVQAMIQEAHDDRYYGPFNLYVPPSYGMKLNLDFKANGNDSIRERLQEIESGGRTIRIRTADQLPANRTVLVQMTSDVLDMVVGQTPVEVSWEAPSGFRFYGAVMAIMVQRVKSNNEGGSGIVLGYTS